MTGLGGHGGSSFSETHVPLAFVDGTPVAEKVSRSLRTTAKSGIYFIHFFSVSA